MTSSEAKDDAAVAQACGICGAMKGAKAWDDDREMVVCSSCWLYKRGTGKYPDNDPEATVP